MYTACKSLCTHDLIQRDSQLYAACNQCSAIYVLYTDIADTLRYLLAGSGEITLDNIEVGLMTLPL